MTGLVIGVDAEHSGGPSSRRLAQPGRGARLSPHSLCRGKEGLGDVDAHFFFEGTLREEAASAFLATLLEQDPGFRAAFVRRIGGGDGADAAAPKIQVEPYLGGGKWPDVLMELPGLLVLVENKVRPRAIRPGQLAEYHVAAVARWPRHRVISVFLTPDRRSGSAEVRRVRRVIRGHARVDAAVVLTWRQVHWLLRFANGSDVEFRRTGIRAIARAIAAYPIRPGIAPPRPTDIRTGQPLDGRP